MRKYRIESFDLLIYSYNKGAKKLRLVSVKFKLVVIPVRTGNKLKIYCNVCEKNFMLVNHIVMTIIQLL